MNSYSYFDKKILRICAKEYKYFFNKKNVVGVGLGFKIKNGFYTLEKCIKVFVSIKLPKSNLNSADLVPVFYNHIKTDVIPIGNISFSKLTRKIRPVLGGYSIGPAIANISGTMGCLVTDGPNLYILSNNHILALANKAPLETPILQPSVEDKGKIKTNIVASLSKYIPLVNNTKKNTTQNLSDSAIAKIESSKIVSSEIALIGYVKGISPIKIGLNVKKVGRTSELTFSKITDIGVTIKLNIFSKEYIFINQVAANKMSTSGDSGAVVLDLNNFVVGLLFSSSNTTSFFTPIKTVLGSLGVSLVTG